MLRLLLADFFLDIFKIHMQVWISSLVLVVLYLFYHCFILICCLIKDPLRHICVKMLLYNAYITNCETVKTRQHLFKALTMKISPLM
jgi:hypothetical protein